MKKKAYSSKSNFPPVGYTKFTANLSDASFKRLKMLSLSKGKSAGKIVEELIVSGGKDIMPEPKPHSTKEGVVLTISDDLPVPPILAKPLDIEDGIEIPEKDKPITFAQIIANTVKSMKVGNSIVVENDSQRNAAHKAARKIGFKMLARKVKETEDDKRLRVWRVE